MEISEARALFTPAGTYLDTATFGLPPRGAVAALEAALAEWRCGRTGFDGWDESVGRSRAAVARLLGVAASDVAVGSQASSLVAPVALGLRPGARVVSVEGEFTSLIFPFLARPDLDVQLVPLAGLLDAVGDGVDLVAVSAVQSSTGEVAPLAELAAAAAAHGARTLVDATQALGWLPLDALRLDYVVASGYKWLCGPRGTAFLAVRPEAASALRVVAPNWYAGEVVADSYYGAPLRLAPDARRFDLSPAWHCFVGLAPALDVLEAVAIERIHDHDVALAARFRAGRGLEAPASAIVSIAVGAEAGERLAARGISASPRAGRLRVSFHLYNTEADVDALLEALE